MNRPERNLSTLVLKILRVEDDPVRADILTEFFWCIHFGQI